MIVLPTIEILYVAYAHLRFDAPSHHPRPPSRADSPQLRDEEPIPRLALRLAVCSSLAGLVHTVACMHAAAHPCRGTACHALAAAAPGSGLANVLTILSLAAFLAPGYVAAHELRHRRGVSANRAFAWLFMTMVLNPVYYVDHMHHHALVGTPEDTASAPRGMSSLEAVIRMELGGWRRALRSSAAAAYSSNGPVAFLQGDAFACGVILSCTIVCLLTSLGQHPTLMYLTAVGIGALFLDVANYMQLYGLRRTRNPVTGTLEQVQLHHSWDCVCPITNQLGFEGGLHAHHHLAPDVQLTGLRSSYGPTYPLGPFCMTILAIFSPLFQRIAHPLLDKMEQQRELDCQQGSDKKRDKDS